MKHRKQTKSQLFLNKTIKQVVLPLFIFLFITVFSSVNTFAQQTGVVISNDSNAVAHPSAILDLQATNRGFLMPRITLAERDAIQNPAEGLLIFNSTTKCFEAYVMSAWYSVSCPEALNPPLTPSYIIGSTTLCESETGITYSINAFPTATNFAWTVPSGWDIISGQGTNQIEVTVGSSSGNVQVNLSDANGSSTLQTLPITVNILPDVPTEGNITSNSTEITWNWNASAGATNYLYNSVNDLNAATNNGSSTTYTQTGLTCGTANTLYVWASNECGTSSELELTYTIICNGPCADSVSFIYNGNTVKYGIKYSKGKCWMDRNLGASQVATSSTDTDAFGDLFQWGRDDDGHQLLTSAITTTLSPTDIPGNSDYITVQDNPLDWRSDNNNNRWNGAVPILNNPCPDGWRVPTADELNDERVSWAPNSAIGAFNDNLKWPASGMRGNDGTISMAGQRGFVWSTTVASDFGSADIYSKYIYFDQNGYTGIHQIPRAWGMSIRCLKDTLTVSSPPLQPSVITGDAEPCTGESNIQYSVDNENGTTYTWTVPSDWTITSGQGANTIDVTVGAASGTIEVIPSNTLGDGPSQTLDVIAKSYPNTPTSRAHTIGETEISWNWNVSAGAINYMYNTVNDLNTAIDNGSSNTYTQTGLTCGTPYTVYVWAHNDCGYSTPLILNENTTSCNPYCGNTVSFTYNGSTVTYGTVLSNSGKCWLDRNLGASRVATSMTDADAYGDLFQWGRRDDGHQVRTSSTSSVCATSDTTALANSFITLYPRWKCSIQDSLWQGVNGKNNPCPTGWRIPSASEFLSEFMYMEHGGNGQTAAFNYILKIPFAGVRSYDGGSNSGTQNWMWTSTGSQDAAQVLIFNGNQPLFYSNAQTYGGSVRCIKDTTHIIPPVPPSPINGNVQPCNGETGLIYNVTPESSVTYLWTVPIGWTITAGQNSNEITVTAGTASGNITVTPSNATLISLDVTPKVIPAAPTAGTITPEEVQIIWRWSAVSGATKYKYSTVNDMASATDNGTNTTFAQTGLTCATAYTLYVWALNDCENSSALTLNANTTACSNGICGGQFTDNRDGNVYNSVAIGNQCWMKENLKYLPSVNSTGSSGTVPYYHVQGYSGTDVNSAKATANYSTYGVLYNWSAAMAGGISSDNIPSGVQGACPSGWHLPSDNEWKEMEMFLGLSQNEADGQSYRGTNQGSKLSGNAPLWANGDMKNNSDFGLSGFSALPGGYRTSGSFYVLNYMSLLWSCTSNGGSAAWQRTIHYDKATIGRISESNYSALSVRCVKDSVFY